MSARSALAVKVEAQEAPVTPPKEATLEEQADFLLKQFLVRIKQERFLDAANYIARRLPDEGTHESSRTQFIRWAFEAALAHGGLLGARACELIVIRFPEAISCEMIERLVELEQSLPVLK